MKTYIKKPISLSLALSLIFMTACYYPDVPGRVEDIDETADTSPPVITLLGENPQLAEAGESYNELGATASDNGDGDISTNISIDSSAVDTSIIASYEVIYSVSDNAGNSASQTRVVDVTDTTPPVITVLGLDPQIIEFGDSYLELGASSIDSFEGDLTDGVIIDFSAVDLESVGSYLVSYTSMDSSGNTVTASRSVNVVDTTAPEITLVGANPQSIEINTTYLELGATANDNLDGDISDSIVIDASEVDMTTEGSYSVTYNVTDNSGNPAALRTRVVNVGVTEEIPVVAFFAGNDGVNGVELFTTDGTPEATNMLKDISDYQISTITSAIKIDNTLFFTIANSDLGAELWKSNGTAAGTVLVKDINQTQAGLGSQIREMTNLNGALFFVATSGTGLNELWKSDGTEQGTQIVKIPDESNNYRLDQLHVLNDQLYFYAATAEFGDELWVSDGTEAGTRIVKDITEGTLGSSLGLFAGFNNELYFIKLVGQNHELWKTDGTSDGTVLIKSFVTSVGAIDEGFHVFQGALYFGAGSDLWRTDGTEIGTVVIKSISFNTSFIEMAVVNNTLFFKANISSQLWKTDGTTDGTMVIESSQDNPRELTVLDGQLIYTTASGNTELWVSDGTEIGTKMLKQTNFDGVTSFANARIFNQSFGNRPIFLPDGRLLFGVDDGINGREPWVTDGTEAGTVLLKDVNPGIEDGYSD